MSVDEVLSWPASRITEWRAHFELQHEDRETARVEEKLKNTMRPRKSNG